MQYRMGVEDVLLSVYLFVQSQELTRGSLLYSTVHNKCILCSVYHVLGLPPLLLYSQPPPSTPRPRPVQDHNT